METSQESKTPNFEMLEVLAIGPDSQLDESIGKRLKSLRGKTNDEVAEELADMINDCVNGSLASGFVLRILQAEYFRLTGHKVTSEIRSGILNILG